MLQLEPLIVEALRERLPTGWLVKGMVTDVGERTAARFASVAVDTGNVADDGGPAACVQVRWQVTLVVDRAADDIVTLDAGIAAAIGALHDWWLGDVAGRRWDRLALNAITTDPLSDPARQRGVVLSFITAATYMGRT